MLLELRATGTTAVRGDPDEPIERRAGHTDYATTEGYTKIAEAPSTTFGDVFPTVPIDALCTGSMQVWSKPDGPRSKLWSKWPISASTYAESLYAKR